MEYNLDRAKDYLHLEWEEIERKLLNQCFANLDLVVHLTEKMNEIEKYKVLQLAHQTLHDIVLAISLNDMIREKEELNGR